MNNLKIKDIPINDRPRERLIKYGPSSLSNVEILSIILKTGTREYSAYDLSMHILKTFGDIKNLKDVTFIELKKIKGIKNAKASTLIAAIELGKRIGVEVDLSEKVKIINSSILYEYYRNILSDKKQECFYCVYLDSQKRIISDKLLFIGTLNRSLVHPREVFKEAYILSASSIICIHNHPSGEVNPSRDDIVITKKLVEIGHLLGIPVIDHVIIGKNKFYSFYENGYI